MAGESDEPDSAAARLEAALERIAAAAARRAAMPPAGSPAGSIIAARPAIETPAAEPGATQMGATAMAAPVAPELAARLDELIERLRGALAVRPG